jgi:long-subunit fatty acid transport protein
MVINLNWIEIKTIHHKTMKKLLSISLIATFSLSVFAGGLVTNTNQSASWVRMPSQNAAISASAVYFNPAGLMRLDNGIHFSVSNQFIKQNRKVENFYTGPDGLTGLNQSVFEGEVFAPLFPSIYAVYKRDKIALSFGVNPVGGGGSANYAKGLPSIEMKPSDLVYSFNPTGAATGVTDYRLSSSFEGSSVFMGYQAGISFDVSEIVSLYAGLRYVSAKNTYNGYLKDIEVFNYGNSGAWTRADAILTGIANSATTGADNLQAAINGGLITGGAALADPTAIAGLTQLGLYTAGMTNNQAITAFRGAAFKYNNSAVLVGDQEADVEETGSGITPVFGINIAASDRVNLAVKLEFPTYIELTRATTKDVQTGWLTPGDTIPDTMFPDGRKYNSDMPAILSAGIDVKPFRKLTLSLSGNYYFDRYEKMQYGKTIYREYVRNYSVIDQNTYEIAGAAAFEITDKILVSGGFLRTKNGVNSYYQSDVSYALSSKTFCFGGAYNISEKMQFNLGVGYTMYEDDYRVIRYPITKSFVLYPKETYYKDNLFVGIGVDFSF